MTEPRKFYTADTHFGHANIIHYCARPFSTVEEMDERLIENWNAVVTPRDAVFHLGDFAFYREERRIREVLRRLNGSKVLIYGNHDRQIMSNHEIQRLFSKCAHYHEVKDGGIRLILSHYRFLVWNGSHHGTIHLHGHSHGTLPGDSQCQDVGVDCWNYFPVTLDQVRQRLAINVPRASEISSKG